MPDLAGVLSTAPNASIPVAYRKRMPNGDERLSAAGILFVTPDNDALFLKRKGADHAGEWSIPAGRIEQDEEPADAARREAIEEVGALKSWGLAPLHRETSDEGVDFVTFGQRTPRFDPTLNDESDEYVWAPLSDPPRPLHPGLAKVLARFFAEEAREPEHKKSGAAKKLENEFKCGANDAEWNESDHPRRDDGKFGTGSGGSGESGMSSERVSMTERAPASLVAKADKRRISEKGQKALDDLNALKESHSKVAAVWRQMDKLINRADELGALPNLPDGWSELQELGEIGEDFSAEYAGDYAKDAAKLKKFEVEPDSDGEYTEVERQEIHMIDGRLQALRSIAINRAKALAKDADAADKALKRFDEGLQTLSDDINQEDRESLNSQWWAVASDFGLDTDENVYRLADRIEYLLGGEPEEWLQSRLEDHAEAIAEEKRWDALTSEEQEAERSAYHEREKQEQAQKKAEIDSRVSAALKRGWRPQFNEHGGWERPKELEEFASPESLKLMYRSMQERGIELPDIPWLKRFVAEDQIGGGAEKVFLSGAPQRSELEREFADDERDEDIDDINIDADHDGPWMSCMSRDGKTMYVNRALPKAVEIQGKRVVVADVLLRHEVPEWLEMQKRYKEFTAKYPTARVDLGKLYRGAHETKGTPGERAYCRRQGIDWNAWSAWCRGEETKIEKGPFTSLPSDADVRPTPHRHDELEATLDDTGVEAYQSGIPQRGELEGINGDAALSARRVPLALDRNSVRTFDKDGRLHISETNVCKACVSPYRGSEIPDWEVLGLEPDRIYQMLRPPEELKKATATINGLPLLRKHVPVSADDHQPWDVAGATGTKARWADPYIKNGLTIWVAEDIEGIENETKCELSPGYHYVAVMEPGTFDGEAYDGRMTQIVFNHLAIVEEGRQGPDVVIGDALSEMQWALLESALESAWRRRAA